MPTGLSVSFLSPHPQHAQCLVLPPIYVLVIKHAHQILFRGEDHEKKLTVYCLAAFQAAVLSHALPALAVYM